MTEPRMAITVTSLEPTHPQGFGGHEFEYEDESDLFRCTRCHRFERVLRDPETGGIPACEGEGK